MLPAVVVVAIDQLTKYWVRTTPALQNWEIIPGWLAFHYTLNPGMALGMDWMPTNVISIVSIIITISFIVLVLYNIREANLGFLFCWGLILGGALGNIIDRLILAKIEGYGGILEGHVVDFIHFTATINGYPVFPYIFNVADIAISVALIALLVFHKQLWPHGEEEEKAAPSEEKNVLGQGAVGKES